MDYPCGKFGDRSFSRFDFILWTDRRVQNHTHTHTDMAERLNPRSDRVRKRGLLASNVCIFIQLSIMSFSVTPCIGGNLPTTMQIQQKKHQRKKVKRQSLSRATERYRVTLISVLTTLSQSTAYEYKASLSLGVPAYLPVFNSTHYTGTTRLT